VDKIDAGIAPLFDLAEAKNEARDDFRGAMPREMAEAAVRALFWVFMTRSRESASIYAYDALMRALEIDWTKSTFVRISETQAPAGP